MTEKDVVHMEGLKNFPQDLPVPEISWFKKVGWTAHCVFEWRWGQRGEWVEGWWKGDGMTGMSHVRFDAHASRAVFSIPRAFSANNSNLVRRCWATFRAAVKKEYGGAEQHSRLLWSWSTEVLSNIQGCCEVGVRRCWATFRARLQNLAEILVFRVRQMSLKLNFRNSRANQRTSAAPHF